MASVKIIGKVAVKVMPDTSQFKQRAKAELERIESQLDDLKVDLVPQISAASKKAVAAEMKALQKQLDGARIDMEANLKESDVAAIEAIIAALTRDRKVKIKTVVDDAAIRRATDSLLMLGGARPQLDGLAQAFEKMKRLDYIAISTGVLATKVTMLGGAALAATGHTASLVGSILKIGPAGLALPGILGGVVVALGSTMAAFKDFNKEVPQTAAYMSELQNILSTNFWGKASAQINAFVDSTFPVIRRNIDETGTALGTFFGNLAESLGTKLNPNLDSMFQNLNKSISIFSGYTDNIANSISVLGNVGSQYLPQLAKYFGDLIAKFDRFISGAAADGSLTKWINEGLTNLRALGSVVGSVSKIFYGLYTAARDAGGSTLVSLADNLRGIAETVNSKGFQGGLTETFKAAFDMMNAITTQAGPGLKSLLLTLSDVFKEVGPGLGEGIGKALGTLFKALSAPSTTSGLLSVFEGINNAITTMTPAIAPMVSILSSLGPVVSALLTNIAGIAANGIGTLAPTITSLAQAIVPVINGLGGLFQKIAKDMAPVFQQVGQNATMVATAFAPLIAAVQKLWNVISPLLIPVLKLVVTIIGSALKGVIQGITMMFNGLTMIVSGVVNVFKGLWNVFAGLFTLDFSRIGKGIGQVFGGLWDIVKGALLTVAGGIWTWLNGSLFSIFRTGFLKLSTKLGGPLKSFGGKIVEFFGKFLQPVVNIFTKLGAGIASAWSKITGIFSSAWSAIADAVALGWAFLKSYIDEAMSGLYFLFAGPWQGIMAFFDVTFATIKAAFMLVWGAIRTFLDDALLRMQMRIEEVWLMIKEGTTAVWSGISTFFIEVWTTIRTFVTSAATAIASKLSGVWTTIKSAVKSAWDTIVNWIKTAWNNIRTKVDESTQGVRDKMSSIWNTIKSKVDSIWNAVKSKISDVWNSIRTTVSDKIGQVRDKMSEVWSAISSKVSDAWGKVKDKVNDKIKEIVARVKKMPDESKAALGNLGMKLVSAGVQLIQGFIDGIQSKIGGVKTTLQDLTSKLTSWKGPAPVDRVLLTPVGEMIIQGLINGLESRYKDVRSSLQGLTAGIASDFNGTAVKVGVAADLSTNGKSLSAVGGLTSKVNGSSIAPSSAAAGVTIGNITIPLSDLEQLKSLEEFLDMLRVRTRQGVIR